VFKKEDKKDQEVRGSLALSIGTYSVNTGEAEKQANEEIRRVIFTGLFEQPLTLIKKFHHQQ
jgi:hypothetical protein